MYWNPSALRTSTMGPATFCAIHPLAMLPARTVLDNHVDVRYNSQARGE